MKTKPEILYRVRTNYPILFTVFIGIAIMVIVFFTLFFWLIKYRLAFIMEPEVLENVYQAFFLTDIPIVLLCSVIIILQSPRLTLTAFKEYLLVSFHIFETRPKKFYPREIVRIAGINESSIKIYHFKGYMGSHPRLVISKPEPDEQDCTHLYVEATTGVFVFKMKDACEVAKHLSEIYPNGQ
jgi:hypothetical protein